MANITWVQGDNAPDQDFLITKNGVALNLTGYTVKFKFGPVDTYVQTNTGHDTCTITSPTTGAVTYQVQTSDTATVGSYIGQLEVINASGKTQTTKDLNVTITPQVA